MAGAPPDDGDGSISFLRRVTLDESQRDRAERDARALRREQGCALLQDEYLLRVALAAIEPDELVEVAPRAIEQILAAAGAASAKLSTLRMNMALAALLRALGAAGRAKLREMLTAQTKTHDEACAAIEQYVAWFESPVRQRKFADLCYESPVSQTNLDRERRCTRVYKLIGRLRYAGAGLPQVPPPRWPTISFGNSLKLDDGTFTFPLQHSASLCTNPSCVPSPTVSTPLPATHWSLLRRPPRRKPQQLLPMTSAAQAERLEGVFAAWEIERRRRATAGEKDIRASPAVKEKWVTEFRVLGGIEAVTMALKRWRGDLARHRHNAASYLPAIGALRTSAHAASFSYQQYEGVVAEIAKSAVATADLWFFFKTRGYVARLRGREPRYRVLAQPVAQAIEPGAVL